jgi:hypothetical protein
LLAWLRFEQISAQLRAELAADTVEIRRLSARLNMGHRLQRKLG